MSTNKSHLRTITSVELTKILKDHKRWLDTDEKEGSYADLGDANLMGADLSRAILRYAFLRYADLRYADLRYADLEGADLWGADLWGANLEGANLEGANLYCANLYCAKLTGANLSGANLEGAKVSSPWKIVDGKLVLEENPVRAQTADNSTVIGSNPGLASVTVFDVCATIDAVFSIQCTLATFDQATQRHILNKLVSALDNRSNKS